MRAGGQVPGEKVIEKRVASVGYGWKLVEDVAGHDKERVTSLEWLI